MDADHKARIMREGPIGLWRTSLGSADALRTDDVRFDADGAGLISIRSLMFGAEDIPFRWAIAAPGQLKLRSVLPKGEEDDEPDYWRVSTLEFRVQQNDLGDVEVMAEAGAEGFWWLMGPLRWVGEPDAT